MPAKKVLNFKFRFVRNNSAVGVFAKKAVATDKTLILDKEPIHVRGPYYLMLHGTIQHNIYHTGQISLLTGQMAVAEAEE